MNATDTKPIKVAVLDPVGFRGGQARALQLVAEAIYQGSRAEGMPAEVVLGYLETPSHQPDDFRELRQEIKQRPFVWKTLSTGEARRALTYAGVPLPEVLEQEYQVPDDGINQFYDCDFWLFISDWLLKPLLPIRSYALMVYDYIQRYEPNVLPAEANLTFLRAARRASGVLVTTKFTLMDALQYAGVALDRVHKVPMLAPDFSRDGVCRQKSEPSDYFIWTTNLAIHKNHVNAVKALRIYYEQLSGSLRCLLTGFNSNAILKGAYPHLEPVREMVVQSQALQDKVVAMGDLPDVRYRNLLANARFLWHPARIDNGSFCVVEAAFLGVPSLSSDYPAMREMDDFYKLGLSWCNPHNPAQMAEQLKRMEQEADARKNDLPDVADLEAKGVASAAVEYWKAVQACL
ncbi:glycosyltransferase [Tepidiphilus succinatimandens]|uniref:glycosyltransferase n=1 Tax=Tepidiphilus succinatimandens TaxID=224436 RepID=UPI00112F79C8|nr:glycosyltransferase [Tepidiphilus succinatimandens]